MKRKSGKAKAAATSIPRRRYTHQWRIFNLRAEEKEQLLEQTRRGQASVRKLRRAQILLLANEGKKDETIAEMLHVGRATVEPIRKRFVLEGLTTAINERPRPGDQRKLGPKREAVLETLAKSEPPEGRTRWTMQLLAKRLVELKVVESISDETVRNVLKKAAQALDNEEMGHSPH